MANSWTQTALLVVDMQVFELPTYLSFLPFDPLKQLRQKDFILPTVPTHLAGALDIVPNVVKAVEVARKRGAFVIWVVREHDPRGRDVELFRRQFYGEGKLSPAMKGCVGAELVDELVMVEGEYKLVKTRFSAFFATNLHSLLQSNGIRNVVVVGIQTPNCIRQTAFDAVALDYQSVTVIVDATAAATPEIHLANIYDMKNVGIATLTLEEWSSANPPI